MSENESTKTKRRGKPHTAMTTAELREATAEFDREFAADTFGPPTAPAAGPGPPRPAKKGPAADRPGCEDDFRHDREGPVGQGGPPRPTVGHQPRRPDRPRTAKRG